MVSSERQRLWASAGYFLLNAKLDERMKVWMWIGLGIAFWASVQLAPAQKALRNVKNYLKQNNPTEALNEIGRLEADTTSDIRFNPKLYHYGVEANIALNNVENEKIYLEQAYDTAKFFSTTYGIFDYAIKCERYEQQRLALKGDRFKYHKEHGELLRRYHKNLGVAGLFFYRKRQYADAMKYLAQYLDAPLLPLWGSDKEVMSTPFYRQNAYLYQRCAFRSKQYAKVARYSTITLSDSARRRRSSLEYLSLAAKELNDSIAFLEYVNMGLRDYPHHPYFFTQMVNYYAQRQAYQQIVALADTLLASDTTNLRYMEAKALAYLNLGHYDAAIQIARDGLAIDSTRSEMNYYIGLAYCSLANTVLLPTNINSNAYRRASAEQKAYYQTARTFLERYRQQEPKKVSRWAPLLYRVYFALNDGAKFEEINEVLKKLFS